MIPRLYPKEYTSNQGISELNEITAETEKEEKSLLRKSSSFRKKIDDRLLSSYSKIRGYQC